MTPMHGRKELVNTMQKQSQKRINAIIAVLLILAMAVTMVACSMNRGANVPSDSSGPGTSDQDTELPEDTPDTAPDPQPKPLPKDEPDEPPEPEMEEVEVEDKVTNIMLIGVDTRSSSTNTLSDTMMLVSYNHDKNAARIVSFMRDSWVKIPDNGWNRMNAANAFGGPELLMETVEENFGVTVDGYALTTFSDFKKIIDLVGGVDVELSKAEIDYINKKLHNEDGDYDNDIESEPGVVHLNGTQALWQVRDRSVGDADFERTSRQRDFMQALVKQTFDDLDIGKMLKLIPAVFECIRTDLDLDEILDIASSVMKQGMPAIETARVPFDGAWEYAHIEGSSVLQIDIDENAAQLDTFLHDGWTHTEEVPKDKADNTEKSDSSPESELPEQSEGESDAA